MEEEEERSPESEFPDTEIKVDFSKSAGAVEFKATRASVSDADREESGIRFVENNSSRQNQKPGNFLIIRVAFKSYNTNFDQENANFDIFVNSGQTLNESFVIIILFKMTLPFSSSFTSN